MVQKADNFKHDNLSNLPVFSDRNSGYMGISGDLIARISVKTIYNVIYETIHWAQCQLSEQTFIYDFGVWRELA